MPWVTPQLREVRALVRDSIRASLPGADANVPNSVLRVLSDAQGGLCHLTLQYIDWLSLQLLPDTAETEFLDRHANIWLVNADNTIGRKQASFATGTAAFSGVSGVVVPIGTRLGAGSVEGTVEYETTGPVTLGAGPTNAPIRAIDAGAIGNLIAGTDMAVLDIISGVNTAVAASDITGGTDVETDEQLRARILHRIRTPPMGGSAGDYVTWALSVPGVERAWAATEQGPGTMTVRFLMSEELRPPDGWPTGADIAAVAAELDEQRPVTVKDCFVLAPVKQILDITIADMFPDPDDVEGAVEASVRDMLKQQAAPGQTIYVAWISNAILNAVGVQSFRLVSPSTDFVMTDPAHMAVLGTILYT